MKPFVFYLLIALGVGLRTASAGPYSDENGGIAWSNSVFEGWIADYQAYTQPDPSSGGYAKNDSGISSTVSNAIIGKPSVFTLDGTTRHVLSLGNGGSIVLSFNRAVDNGAGPDFAVFENGFTDESPLDGTVREGATNSFTYAELAFVDVATTTSAWARFPCVYLGTDIVYNLPDVTTNRFASQDVTLLDGLAGKHAIGFGTPFDLSVLTNEPNVRNGAVNLSRINYIRLTDVIGSGSTTDSTGRAIYDPYYNFQTGYPDPAFPASNDGFDLRAVGVIHFAAPEAAIRRGESNRVEILVQTMTNRNYQLQSADILVETNWVNVGSVLAGDDAEHLLAETNKMGSCRYYRVVEIDP